MTEELRARVDRIVQKLERVRTQGLSCFGANAHRFQLAGPLPESAVAAFEAVHKVRLPEDYRAFLRHAGNGGAGPYYGIYPLAKWDDLAAGLDEERLDEFFARSCPLDPALRATAGWEERLGPGSPYVGTLSIGTQGCAIAMQLIVTGKYRGRVVYVNGDALPPYVTWEPDFLSWYERWLDELLGGYRMDNFGYGPGGGAEDLGRILTDKAARADERVEAAQGFRRLPRLSDTAVALLLTHLDEPNAGVRAALCAAVRTFQLHKAQARVAALLADDVPEVRREAMWTLMALAPESWTGAVLKLLRTDPDSAVTSAAFSKVKECGALTRSELLRIVTESPSGELRSRAAHAISWTADDQELLVRLLADSYPRARFYATLGLRQLKARAALPTVAALLGREQDRHVAASALHMLGDLGDASVVPTLLLWAQGSDDFLRLDALGALAKIGDRRALPIAAAMLAEQRQPVRRDARGFTQQTSIHTIAELVCKALQDSPSPELRKLVR